MHHGAPKALSPAPGQLRSCLGGPSAPEDFSASVCWWSSRGPALPHMEEEGDILGEKQQLFPLGSLSAQAALTKYPRWGASTTEINFLTVLEAGSLRSRVLRAWVLVSAAFQACRWLPSLDAVLKSSRPQLPIPSPWGDAFPKAHIERHTFQSLATGLAHPSLF